MDDRDRVLLSLRAILDAPGTSGKALEAKSRAAAQLARMTGTDPTGYGGAKDPVDEQAPDPMADLDRLAAQRKLRARKGLTPADVEERARIREAQKRWSA